MTAHEYVIAIPSHRRAPRVRETLAWLRKTDVDLARVHLFLSDAEDTQAYADIDAIKVETGAKNVVEKFNAIHRHFTPGTRVFVLEDDVTVVVADDAGKPTPCLALDALITAGFAGVGRAGLWGIVPHANPFYFGGKTTQTLKLVVAHAFGFVSTQDPRLEVTLTGKSDYERTILYWIRYGRVTRVDTAGCLTKSYTAPGGMQSDLTRDARAAAEKSACDYLVNRYPHLIGHNKKKTSLFAELSFKIASPQEPAYLQVVQRKLDLERGYART